jgi:hypothetical protein
MPNKINTMKLIVYLAAGIACVGLALIYLNSAAYNFWLTYGPPTQDPGAFFVKSIRHLIYSAALFLLAGVSFYLYRKLRKSNKPVS